MEVFSLSQENIVGKRLASLREKAGYSQVELAKKLNVSPSTIAMWELGEREIKTSILIKIADFFNVPTDYLTGRIDTTNETNQDVSIPPEEREFLEWVKNNLEGTFFYDFSRAPEEQKRDMMKSLRIIWELEKHRKPGQKQGE
jgi:transcriptional regulator with XRE-family HTH domain